MTKNEDDRNILYNLKRLNSIEIIVELWNTEIKIVIINPTEQKIVLEKNIL